MARFKASRFLRSPKAATAVDPKAEASDDSNAKAAPATEAPPAARVVEPMKPRPNVQQEESHVDSARRVDPGQTTLRRVDPSEIVKPAPHEPPPVQRVASAADLKQPETDSPVSLRGSNLVDEKADSSVTSVDDERGSGEKLDPGSLGDADGGADGGILGKAVEDYTADDFSSRASAEGFGQFEDSTGDDPPAGADRIPAGTLADSVESSLAGDETTLVDPADMTKDGPEMPAGFDQSPSNLDAANLRGLAAEADEHSSSSMASLGGFAEEDPDAATTDSTGADDQTSADGTSLSEEDRKELDATGATETLEDEGYNVDDMTADQVHDALNDIADNEQIVKPGKEYLEARDYDTANMTDQEVLDSLDKEASYEFSGGQGGTSTSPSYVDADSGGGEEGSAQVAADAEKLHVPTSPIRGNIDPTEFGNGAAEATDTSILDMSDPVNPEDSMSFGGGSMGTPPPRAQVDFGPDHVDENSGGGLSDDIGGIGIGHDDGTLGIDFGADDSGTDADTGGLIDELSNIDDPSHMADAPDIGFAIDPGDVAADSPIDLADDFHHVDRVDDIFE